MFYNGHIGIKILEIALTAHRARRDLTLFRFALTITTASGFFSCSRTRDSSSQSGTTGVYGAMGTSGCGGDGHDELLISLSILAVIVNI